MTFLLTAAISYVLGSIPFGYILFTFLWSYLTELPLDTMTTVYIP